MRSLAQKMEAGYRIKLVETRFQTPSVDDPADIEKALRGLQ